MRPVWRRVGSSAGGEDGVCYVGDEFDEGGAHGVAGVEVDGAWAQRVYEAGVHGNVGAEVCVGFEGGEGFGAAGAAGVLPGEGEAPEGA